MDKMFGMPIVHQNQEMRRLFISWLTCTTVSAPVFFDDAPLLLLDSGIISVGDIEKKKERRICVDNKKKKNCYLRVVELTWVLDPAKLYLLHIKVKKDAHMPVLLKGSVRLVLMLPRLVLGWLFFITYMMLRSPSVIQKKIQPEGYISSPRRGVFQPSWKDITLSSGYHDGTLQVMSSYIAIIHVPKNEEEFFSDIPERPVMSLLRGFSFPVCVESDLQRRLNSEMPLGSLTKNITWKEKHLGMNSAKELDFIFDTKMTKFQNKVLTKVLIQWKVHPPNQATRGLYQDFINKYPQLVALYYDRNSGLHILSWAASGMTHGVSDVGKVDVDKEKIWKTVKQIMWNGSSKHVMITKVKHNLENCLGGSLLASLKIQKDILVMIMDPYHNAKFINYLGNLVRSYLVSIMKIAAILKGATVFTLTLEQFEYPLTSILTYEIFHTPRPPELSFSRVRPWFWHPTGLLMHVCNVSSLRTRMC